MSKISFAIDELSKYTGSLDDFGGVSLGVLRRAKTALEDVAPFLLRLEEALAAERAMAYAQQDPEDYEEMIEATDAIIAFFKEAK